MQLFLTREALKQYGHISTIEKKKIQKKIAILEGDPLAGKKLVGKLVDTRSLRAWPYRIIYSVDTKKKEVWVISILHRQGAYQ